MSLLEQVASLPFGGAGLLASTIFRLSLVMAMPLLILRKSSSP